MSGRLTWKGVVRQLGSCAQSVKDFLLTGDCKSIPVSIWKEHFDKMDSGLFYKFTAMKLHQFNGLVLSSQTFTESIDVCDSFGVTET